MQSELQDHSVGSNNAIESQYRCYRELFNNNTNSQTETQTQLTVIGTPAVNFKTTSIAGMTRMMLEEHQNAAQATVAMNTHLNAMSPLHAQVFSGQTMR
jgi:hypothetical protein